MSEYVVEWEWKKDCQSQKIEGDKPCHPGPHIGSKNEGLSLFYINPIQYKAA